MPTRSLAFCSCSLWQGLPLIPPFPYTLPPSPALSRYCAPLSALAALHVGCSDIWASIPVPSDPISRALRAGRVQGKPLITGDYEVRRVCPHRHTAFVT